MGCIESWEQRRWNSYVGGGSLCDARHSCLGERAGRPAGRLAGWLRRVGSPGRRCWRAQPGQRPSRPHHTEQAFAPAVGPSGSCPAPLGSPACTRGEDAAAVAAAERQHAAAAVSATGWQPEYSPCCRPCCRRQAGRRGGAGRGPSGGQPLAAARHPSPAMLLLSLPSPASLTCSLRGRGGW